MNKPRIKFIDEPLFEPHKITKDGLNSSMLRDNETFVEIVNDLYLELSGHEDSISSSLMADTPEAEDMRLYYSKMRVSLVSLVKELDYRVEEAEKLSHEDDDDDSEQGKE